MIKHRSIFVLAALPTLFGLSDARGQNVVLDEGTFRITQGGQEVGTETFSIRRMGTGNDVRIVANGVVELNLPTGKRELRPLLQAGADLSLAAYQIKVSGDEQTEIRVETRDRRLVAHMHSADGEMEREYRAVEGAVLLEKDVAHHYRFVGERADREGATIPVMIPRTSKQGVLSVRSISTESLQIGDAQVSARHIRLTLDGDAQDLWVDDRDRVLKVEVPSTGWSAVRTSP